MRRSFVSPILVFRGLGRAFIDQQCLPQCTTARWEAVQLDRQGFEYRCDCALGRAPDLNLSDSVIGWLHKQYGGCTTQQHHCHRTTTLRAWRIGKRVAFGDQCRF
jgi:hypothetical protein